MSEWISCNSCFLPPSADRQLAVTTCGHVICGGCYQKDTPDKCLICKAKCQLAPLSDKSSSKVKTMFSSINIVARKHAKEISKVLMFQAKHQHRLLTYYQQKNGKLEEVLVKMKQEMQQMTKKLNEQSAYITKLENSLQHQSRVHTPHGNTSVMEIPHYSTMSLSRQSSMTNIADNMEKSKFKKPNTVPRVSLINPPYDGRTGNISHRSSNEMLVSPSAHSATVRQPVIPDLSYRHNPGWKAPTLNPLSSSRHSMSFMVNSPLNRTHT